DLTLRDLQANLKKLGHPWEIAKAFDGSCPITPFEPINGNIDLQNLEFYLDINNTRRQNGNTKDMITPIVKLISFISNHFTLLPGDIVLTGTPAGVDALNPTDTINIGFNHKNYTSCVI
ncbi:MAG: fumarylacetoacetate hydrolase family protein, partial [Romboutsia sp.]|nr:fumarylacetoacetate hydrolase family protein [Romboutsia sp.]